ncbi:hypothetical protein TSAR_003840, partial [Trichomalopsis sarcophagae]
IARRRKKLLNSFPLCLEALCTYTAGVLRIASCTYTCVCVCVCGGRAGKWQDERSGCALGFRICRLCSVLLCAAAAASSAGGIDAKIRGSGVGELWISRLAYTGFNFPRAFVDRIYILYIQYNRSLEICETKDSKLRQS